MAQQEIELILMRQLASYLALPIFLIDDSGRLLYFNEPAEALLGLRFDEIGPLPAEEWAGAFTPTDDAGVPLAADELPIMVALATARPAHRGFWIQGRDGARRRLRATGVPLVGIAGRCVGAAAIFWEAPAPP